ncbi:BatA domain-containing protein [bacterium]|nr:BatA domain-containing protein [bacterium]
MSFLNPLLLYFLPAIIIPLILNLFPGLSAKKIPFPLYFLINKTKSGHGINLRSILKTIIRMLIIGTLILIFAHPYIKTGQRDDMIIFDNSIYTRILKNNVPIFNEGKKLLKQMRSKNIYTFNEKGLYPVKKIDDIQIMKNAIDLDLIRRPSQYNNVILISPFTQKFDIDGNMYDLFPENFYNVGIIFKSYSIIEHSINICVYSQNKDANIQILAKNNTQDINIFSGEIKKDQPVNLILKIPLDGQVKILVNVLNFKDSFFPDNSTSVYFPQKLVINLRYKNKFLEKFIAVLSNKIPVEYSKKGLLISKGNEMGSGIFFHGTTSLIKTKIFYENEGDYIIPINIRSIQKKEGTVLISSYKNEAVAIMQKKRLDLAFDLESNSKILKEPEFINMFTKTFDDFLVHYYCNSHPKENLGPVKHYAPTSNSYTENKKEKPKDYQKGLILLFSILMVFELLI